MHDHLSCIMHSKNIIRKDLTINGKQSWNWKKKDAFELYGDQCDLNANEESTNKSVKKNH